VLPLRECAAESIAAESVADPIATKSASEHLHSIADPATDPTTAKSIADPTTAESTSEPLHSVADPAAVGAAPTETSCLCV
jgi:hypothetical protein